MAANAFSAPRPGRLTFSIVSLALGLGLGFCVPVRGLAAADEEPAGGHLDPLQTTAKFLNLAQSGKTGDIRAAGRMIEPDRLDQAWANDQLDSNSRDMLLTMHVYDFVAILGQDPVVGQPQYFRHRERPVATVPTSTAPKPVSIEELMGTAPTESAPATPAAPAAPAAGGEVISEAEAERAAVKLESGRTIDLVKSPNGDWLLEQRSSSLQVRAEWVENRDRDLQLPSSKQFSSFFLDMEVHDTDYAWRVAMALGEAGRFADLGQLIQFPPSPPPPADADQAARAAAEKARVAKLEEQGRLLYSWLRRSTPKRVRREASALRLPADPALQSPNVPSIDGRVANFVIWTTDYKRVRLVVRQRPVPPDTIDLGLPIYEWRFDSDCYSPETKRAWIHAQRQPLTDQP